MYGLWPFYSRNRGLKFSYVRLHCTALRLYRKTYIFSATADATKFSRAISGVNVRLKTKFRKLPLSPSSGSTLNINCTVLCAHFNKMYIRGHTTIIYHLRIRTVKDKNSLLVFKNSARRSFLALGSNGKTILGPREEKRWTTLIRPVNILAHPFNTEYGGSMFLRNGSTRNISQCNNPEDHNLIPHHLECLESVLH
jgi:hypothetical protein